MDLLFDNFQILLVLGLALAAWLKNRGDAKQEEDAEREAREEMIRHLKEVEQRPIEKPSSRSTPPPVPQGWDTSPQSPAPSGSKPPPLKEIFREVAKQLEPPPLERRPMPAPAPAPTAYDEQPAPWDFEHVDTSDSEISDAHESQDPVLDRQRHMQERLAELKRQAEEYKGQAAGARETQRRVSGKSSTSISDLPPIAAALKDRSQTRRAIILSEILNKPIALR